MKSSLFLLAAVGLLPLFSSSAVARPASISDFTGKTICWNDGDKSTFRADGKLEDSLGGPGTWRFSAAGLEMHTAGWGGAMDVQIQTDGTYVSTGPGFGGRTAQFSAHVCK